MIFHDTNLSLRPSTNIQVEIKLTGNAKTVDAVLVAQLKACRF
jgi:hypothetical protein